MMGERVDQMKRAWTRSAGGGRSKVGGAELASFFELMKPVQVNGLEWSGIAARANHSETFVVRLFRDADEVPGALVKELRVGARLTPATEVKYPPSTGNTAPVAHADSSPAR